MGVMCEIFREELCAIRQPTALKMTSLENLELKRSQTAQVQINREMTCIR